VNEGVRDAGPRGAGAVWCLTLKPSRRVITRTVLEKRPESGMGTGSSTSMPAAFKLRSTCSTSHGKAHHE